MNAPRFRAAPTLERSRRPLFARTALLVPAIGLLLASATACQQKGDPEVVLTMEQWRHVRENFLEEVPVSSMAVGAVFDDNIELIAWDYRPRNAMIGEEVTLKFYWRLGEVIDDDWEIFVHAEAGGHRQSFDHHGVDGTFPMRHWPAGKIIEDHVTRELSPSLGNGDVSLLMGLYHGDERASVTSVGSVSVTDDDRLVAGSFGASWDAPVLEASYLQSPVVIDGRLSDRAWAQTQPTPTWTSPVTGEPVESQHAWGKALWDEEFLYIGLRARDTDIWSTFEERDQDLWEEEVLEVYLDVGNDGRNYLELQVNPNNAVFDALFPQLHGRDHTVSRNHTVEGMETAVHVQGTNNARGDRDRYWSVELKIPFASVPDLALPVANGTEIGLNFYRYDRPATGEVFTTGWSTVGAGSFHNPARFGLLRLETRPEEAVETESGEVLEAAEAGPGTEEAAAE